MISTTPGACPRCGAPLFPVLDVPRVGSGSGPVPADPQVRMTCAACPDAEAPSLSAR